MQYIRITAEWFDALKRLQTAYKQEIGEDAPTAADLESLRQAVDDGRIQFYGCVDAEKLVACCSVSVVYSTFVTAAAACSRISISCRLTGIEGSRVRWFVTHTMPAASGR